MLATLAVSASVAAATDLRPVDAKRAPDLFVWQDTCDVYVLRDGDAALLLNLGDRFQAIDAVIVTLMHGDHFLEAPHLRTTWGAEIGALDNMLDKMDHPDWFDYAAPIQAYGKKHPDGSPMSGGIVDRAFKPGERFTWEGYEFTVDWMPGQTEFALCLHGLIDGRKVAFTGDNIFGDPSDARQTGHEAVSRLGASRRTADQGRPLAVDRSSRSATNSRAGSNGPGNSGARRGGPGSWPSASGSATRTTTSLGTDRPSLPRG